MKDNGTDLSVDSVSSVADGSSSGSEERSLLESISNHVGARGAMRQQEPELFATESTEDTEEDA